MYSENGQPVPNGFVRGGMGQITALMAEAAREHGVEIRSGAAVARILVEGGQARGVELASGDQIAAQRVISNLDPKRTFTRLIDAQQLDGRFLRRIHALQTNVAAGLKLHCALAEAPDRSYFGSARWRNWPTIARQLRSCT